jgi:hypothetical protein
MAVDWLAISLRPFVALGENPKAPARSDARQRKIGGAKAGMRETVMAAALLVYFLVL